MDVLNNKNDNSLLKNAIESQDALMFCKRCGKSDHKDARNRKCIYNINNKHIQNNVIYPFLLLKLIYFTEFYCCFKE